MTLTMPATRGACCSPRRFHSARTAGPKEADSVRPHGEPMTTTTAAPVPAGSPVRDGPPVLDVVIPVYNEQTDLEPCERRLRAYPTATCPHPSRNPCADHASTGGNGR